MLNSPIVKKMTLIILITSFGSIFISGLLIHLSLNRQFQHYLTRTEHTREQQVVRIIAEIYQEVGDWSNFPSQFFMGRRRRPLMGNLSHITDSNGQLAVVFRHRMNAPPKEFHSYPIIIGNRTVGTAYFGQTVLQGVLTGQNRLFRKTINRSIMVAIIATGLISLLVALIFAKRFSIPITEMNQIARNMTMGNLDTRVNNLPLDELGELGNSINNLAERLKNVEELRKKMTADVAHDLRTPLTTVRSHLEGMIDSVIPASQENLESLLEEVNRLIALVNDLQAIAIADTAIHQFKIETIDLKTFFQDLTKKMAPLFQDKGIRLALEDMPPCFIDVDRIALTKIFDNLLANALKFTPTGKKVRLNVTQNENFAEIKVIDEGIGIGESDLPFIFERFYRTDQSRCRESGGFGLGLTIVKELTEALGGSVSVTSEIDKGSVFIIRFPMTN